jgi:hypothetical protein
VRVYSDLAAYALMSPREAVGTYVREHGLAGLRGLGQAVSADVAQANIMAGLAWVQNNPLPDDAPADAVQARALVVAALQAAQAKLNGDPASGSTSAEFQQAAATYNQYKAAAYQADMPSPFAMSLANLFGSGGLFDLSTTFGKVAVYGGAVLAAWVLVPRVMQGMRGSKSA